MSETDTELLQNYAETGSSAVFSILVERHVNLVFSVARRHVGSPLAEDVTQAVFIELARNARRIKPGTPLVAWLHVVSRRNAINALRSETRRQQREIDAVEIDSMKPSSSSVWTELEPLLDAALEKLSEADRTAVLLRFFENKSMREVGAALGASEEAAQRRVSRAVDRLRNLFAKGGVTIAAASLTSELSAHAIQAAPAKLGLTITAVASPLVSAIPVSTVVTQTFAMTTLQKSAIAAVLALAVGGIAYESSAYTRQQSDETSLRRQVSGLESDLRKIREQRLASNSRLQNVEHEIDNRVALLNARVERGDAALEEKMRTWLGNLTQLKEFLRQQPNLSIPELQFLSESDWFDVAASGKLDSEASIRRTLSQLRQRGENAMGNRIRNALADYLKANDNTLPTQIAQLLPYFEPAIDPALLLRYQMLRSGKFSGLSEKEQMSIVGSGPPVDVEYDASWKIGVQGFMTTSAMDVNMNAAQEAFATANSGKRATTATELMPYLKWPAPVEAVERHLKGNRKEPITK